MSFSFLFPGQGSQYTGMFKEHFEEFPEFNEILGLGEEYYKEDFKSIIFTEDPRLSDTYYTQPILMLMSYALFKVWERHKSKSSHGRNVFHQSFRNPYEGSNPGPLDLKSTTLPTTPWRRNISGEKSGTSTSSSFKHEVDLLNFLAMISFSFME